MASPLSMPAFFPISFYTSLYAKFQSEDSVITTTSNTVERGRATEPKELSMSIFASQPGFMPPPSYTSTKIQPPAYKPTRRSQLTSITNSQPSLTQPPPTYNRSPSPVPSSQTPLPPPYHSASTSKEEKENKPSVWSPVTEFLTWISFSLTSTSSSIPSSNSTFTGREAPDHLESSITDAEDDLYRMKEEGRKKEGEGSDWCCGCFWTGPQTTTPWITPYVIF